MKIIFIIIFLSMVGGIHATQYVPMDSSQVIRVNLSNRNHNRVGVIGERVKKAFFKTSNISVEIEEVSGQFFVQALNPNCPLTTLSIVTSSGNIQDLELKFYDIPTEIVLLQPTPLPTYISDEIQDCVMPFDENSIRTLVEGLMKGNLPEGYVSIEDQEEPQALREGLKMQRLYRLVNDEQIIFVYRITNSSKREKCLTECEVNILDGEWVFMDRYKFQPNECGVILIGCFR